MISRESKLMRREFWRRCRTLTKVSIPYIVRADGAIVRIVNYPGSGPRSQSFCRASVQLKHGGGVSHISEKELGGFEAIENALPILRRHMVLDDIANA
jgi:hypothetical protein